MTFNEFAIKYGITLTSTRIDARPDNILDMPVGSSHFKCLLKNKNLNTRMSQYFSLGAAYTSPPTLSDLLPCLLMDIQSSDDSFEDWCSSMGCDSDSRKVERIYNSCRACKNKLVKFLGKEVFDAFTVCTDD